MKFQFLLIFSAVVTKMRSSLHLVARILSSAYGLVQFWLSPEFFSSKKRRDYFVFSFHQARLASLVSMLDQSSDSH